MPTPVEKKKHILTGGRAVMQETVMIVRGLKVDFVMMNEEVILVSLEFAAKLINN